MNKRKILKLFLISNVLILSGCGSLNWESKYTKNHNDACKMLKENPDWLKSMVQSRSKWGTPISIQLSFIRQESSFKHDARPIRNNEWFEFGVNYQSSALGYSQALDGTWDHYTKDTKNTFRNRSSFKDSVDFIGWYNHQSYKNIGLSKTDSYSLYLAYHDGWTGYKNKSYKNKKFLKNAASNVKMWSTKYSKQLNKCRLKVY